MRNRSFARASADHIIAMMAEYFWRTVAEMPWPADWPAVFGREAPLLMEIGFGSGLFLVDLARRRPEADLIGLEIALPSLRNALRKVARSRLTNVCLIKDGAWPVLQVLCAPGSLAGVTINFPDPWPKKSHQVRRLIDDDFLRLLATRLTPGADLDIATDHADYADQIEGCLSRSPHFTSRTAAPFVWDDPGRVRTKYEQVALAEGRPPRYFQWRRNVSPAADIFPIPQELPMPHVVVRIPTSLDEIGRRFRPWSVEQGSVPLKYLEAYQSFHDGALLIEAYLNESPISQRLALELRPRATGDVVIGLHEVGFPRPTRGVHLAVHHLISWLTDHYPATVIVQSTLKLTDADD